MIDRLEQMEQRYDELQAPALACPKSSPTTRNIRRPARRCANSKRRCMKFRELKQVRQGLAEARAMLAESDPDLRAMAEEEIAVTRSARARSRRRDQGPAAAQGSQRREERHPRNPRRHRRRRGLALCRRNLPHVHSASPSSTAGRSKCCRISESGVGGYKEVIAIIEGERVYSQLKWESGVHRVQRVPATETQGRVHTSAVTVAVLPEAEEVDIKIEAKDIPHRHLLLLRSRRPVGQHHLLRRPHHPHSHQHRRQLPGREIADQESRKRHARSALAPL